MAQPVRIIVGYMSHECRAFLLAHQVPITQFQDLEMIILTRESGAGLSRSIRPLEYVISFYVNENDVSEDCCVLFLSPDCAESKLIFRPGYWSIFEQEQGPVI